MDLFGYPSSSVCPGSPSSPVCPEYPSSPVCPESPSSSVWPRDLNSPVCHGSPSSSECPGYPSFLVCSGNPSSPVCPEYPSFPGCPGSTRCSKYPVALFIEPARASSDQIRGRNKTNIDLNQLGAIYRFPLNSISGTKFNEFDLHTARFKFFLNL